MKLEAIFKQLTIGTICCLGLFNATAQNPCEVLLESIKGTYAGECKKDKANGAGKAVGIDTYEGNFKSGYPDGEGIYTYKNGDNYVGNFKKGNMDGKGVFRYKKANAEDSVITGYWVKNEYQGDFEKPFILHYKSNGVTDVSIKEQRSSTTQILIISEPKNRFKNYVQTVPQPVTSVNVTSGNFTNESKTKSPTSAISTLISPTFPFRAIIQFGTHSIEVELFRPASWEIQVKLLDK